MNIKTIKAALQSSDRQTTYFVTIEKVTYPSGSNYLPSAVRRNDIVYVLENRRAYSLGLTDLPAYWQVTEFVLATWPKEIVIADALDHLTEGTVEVELRDGDRCFSVQLPVSGLVETDFVYPTAIGWNDNVWIMRNEGMHLLGGDVPEYARVHTREISDRDVVSCRKS